MLHVVGTMSEVQALPCHLPLGARDELIRCTAILDHEYGADRDYRNEGGFALIAETRDDLSAIKSYVDCDTHPSEWVERHDGYAVALYVMGSDLTIQVFIPLTFAPDVILNEMED